MKKTAFDFEDLTISAETVVLSTILIDNLGGTVYSGQEIKISQKSPAQSCYCYFRDATPNAYREVVNHWADQGVKRAVFVSETDQVDEGMCPAVVVTDHINVSGMNPLIGPNDETRGTRFPDMTELYSRTLSAKVKQCCLVAGLSVCERVLLVPKSMTRRTDLERRILALRKDVIISQDIFSGVITARHRSLSSAGIFLYNGLTLRQKTALIEALLEQI